ncbi:helix-turn-helix domain-containing protein [Nocardia jiangxiensis]|uniref:Helix-turn-helix domain-containing protein n=1 Tax=Nocardia jiangxiensis TaxID=282685 RepID=A0ABW6SB59_9NOCA
MAGIRLNSAGRVIRFAHDGREAPDTAMPASTTVAVTLDEEEIGTVWLERPGPPSALDQLLLERLALATASVVERYGPAHTTMADPALVELVISAGTDEPARNRALRLMGFAAELPIRVVAVHSPVAIDRIGSLICPDRPVKAATVADVGVILATTVDAARFPPEVRAGIGAADSPDRSWSEARTALRFTTSRIPIIHHDDLGALSVLDRIPANLLQDNADIAAIDRIASRPEDLDTLDAYCTTGSLRRAADLLHLHHSSVARRLENLGRTLGFDLTAPPDSCARASH